MKAKSSLFRILSLLLFFVASGAWAAGDEASGEVSYLCVWHEDGSAIAFPLSESPRVFVNQPEQTLKCVSDRAEYEFGIHEIARYTLEAVLPTSLGQPMPEGTFAFTPYRISLSGYGPGTAVSVYTSDGSLVEALATTPQGTLTIDLSRYRKGIYLIKTDSRTYKIMKR